mmetsp:Transcript_62466/g.116035  ORF Transcript_62466/g.116035 Transcript_62466/m.116035 type:complete len:839 (+) Transcript_62466:111-2627(+)
MLWAQLAYIACAGLLALQLHPAVGAFAGKVGSHAPTGDLAVQATSTVQTNTHLADQQSSPKPLMRNEPRLQQERTGQVDLEVLTDGSVVEAGARTANMGSSSPNRRLMRSEVQTSNIEGDGSVVTSHTTAGGASPSKNAWPHPATWLKAALHSLTEYRNARSGEGEEAQLTTGATRGTQTKQSILRALPARMLLCAVVLLVMSRLAVPFIVAFYCRCRCRGDMPRPTADGASGAPSCHLLVVFSKLCRPYYWSEAGRKGRTYSYMVLACTTVSIVIAFVHNRWQKQWWDHYQREDQTTLLPFGAAFVVLIITSALADVYEHYIGSTLLTHWREFMTRRLYQMWLDNHSSHFLAHIGQGPSNQQAENPDQRLQEGIQLFTRQTLRMFQGFVTAIGTLAVFIPVVLALEPEAPIKTSEPLQGWLLLVMAFWSAFVSMIPASIRRQLKGERTGKDEAEQPLGGCFLMPSPVVGDELHRWEYVKAIIWQAMHAIKPFIFFRTLYGYLSFMVPFVLLAPSFLASDLTLGDLFQLAGALDRVRISLELIIEIIADFGAWRSVAAHLLEFEQALAALSAMKWKGSLVASDVKSSSSELIQASVDEVRLPNGDVIWKHVLLEIQPGHRVLISGPDGSGKSTLLKALAGVWPWADGASIRVPSGSCPGDKKEVLLVPQHPVFPCACSLRQAISYPELETTYKDTQLLAALRSVGLHSLLGDSLMQGSDETTLCDDQEGQQASEWLDAIADWTESLSPACKQRLALAHVLLQRPSVLLLDDVTSSVGTDAAAQLYEVILASLPADVVVVSVSNDIETLRCLHDTHYEVQGNGKDKQLQCDNGQAEIRE